MTASAAATDQRTRAPGRRPSLKLSLAVVVGLYAVIFTFWQAEPVPWLVHAAAILLWAICVLPLLLWYGRRSTALPLFEFICLAYGLQFSMPVYTQPNIVSTSRLWVPLRWDETLITLLITAFGVGMLIAGYYAVQRWHLLQAAPRLDLPLRPERRPIYLALAFGLGLLGLYLQVSGDVLVSEGLNSIVGVLANQFRLALIILAYQVYGLTRQRVGATVLLYLLLGAGLILGLTSGMLENALIPIVLLFLVRWQASGKFPVWFVILAFLAFIVLNAVKGDYRDAAWYGSRSLDLSERLTLWVDLGQDVVSDTTSGDVLTNVQDLIRQSLSRFDLIHKFVYVREMTPRFVPYYEGRTYEYLLVGWIPRFLWADKPDASAANHRMDVDYGFLEERQTLTTNIGIGQLPEAYANFGLAGLVGIMLLQGMIFGTLNHLYNGPASDGGRAIYLSLMIFFFNGIGSSAVVWFGALVQNLAANTLILRVFSSGFKAAETPQLPAAEAARPTATERTTAYKRQAATRRSRPQG